jgi:hypothetical protein
MPRVCEAKTQDVSLDILVSLARLKIEILAREIRPEANGRRGETSAGNWQLRRKILI